MIDSKQCKTCQIDKPIAEYYRHKGSPDGFEYECKECYRARVDKRRRSKLEDTAPVFVPAPGTGLDADLHILRLVPLTSDERDAFDRIVELARLAPTGRSPTSEELARVQAEAHKRWFWGALRRRLRDGDRERWHARLLVRAVSLTAFWARHKETS